jgi:hypothetical protein
VNHWWRAYNEAVNDPKLQLISDALFRAWFNLMCIASGNDGKLPPIADIAFTLRMKTDKAAQILTQLYKAGLLDKTETGFTPHNWNGRQYKSDVSTERVKRFRNGKRNVSSAVTETPPDTELDTEDRIGDARASVSSFTEGSKALSAALWKALGITHPLQVPIELAGSDWRAIEWERAGWTVDLVDAEARRIGPGKPLTYYEKCFATSFAKRQAPLPIVEVREAEKLTVTHGPNQIRSGGSLTASIRRELAELERSESADFALPASSLLRISG